MNLEIVSPEKLIYSGNAELVSMPGFNGSFAILNRHAPIISVLKKGTMKYRINGNDKEVVINGGFIEVKKNIVSVCIE